MRILNHIQQCPNLCNVAWSSKFCSLHMYVLPPYSLCIYMQSPQSVVPVGMTKSAVCVNAEENYGVVEVHRGSVMCTTCKYGRSSCQHVSHLTAMISDLCAEELPSYLENFRRHLAPLDNPSTTTQSQIASCVSTKKIPFNLPTHMLSIVKESATSRYSLDNLGVAHLAPLVESNVACSECGGCSWSEDAYLIASCFLVTLQGLYPAKGQSIMFNVCSFIPSLIQNLCE